MTEPWSSSRRRLAAVVVALVVVAAAIVIWSVREVPGAKAAAGPAGVASSSSTSRPPTTTDRPPPTTAPSPPIPLEARVLTPDGGDTYAVGWEGEAIVVHAAPTNQGGNLRVLAVGGAEPPTTDQRACATWDGPLEDLVQPGLALRVRDRDGGTQALTVTNNVFGASRWVWNVHAWIPSRIWRLASIELPGALFQSAESIAPLPWHLCAEVRGSRLRFVVWTGDDPAPPWGDPSHGAAIDLPAGWDYAGRGGVYAGHLLAGGTTSFRDLVTSSLEEGSDPGPVAIP